jgi:hypothetical protein
MQEDLNRAKFVRAFGAGAHGAKKIECINSGTMSVGKIYFYSVVADGLSGFRTWLRLEHWQDAGWNRPACSCRCWNFRGLFCSLVAASGAWTIFAQINKVVMAGVAVGPSDVHTRAGGDVNFHVGGFFASVEWRGHFISDRN